MYRISFGKFGRPMTNIWFIVIAILIQNMATDNW